MKLTFNQWQAHLANQLQIDLVKLKLIRPNEKANIRTISRKKSANI
jgi:hypothetical protein